MCEDYFPKDQSKEIGKLALALSKAQSEIEGAKTDSENPFFHSKYADLKSVWRAIREPLAKNELAVIQTNRSVDPSVIEIVTTLVHSSGQWVKGHIKLKPTKQDPQGYGSAMTYARRYSLSAIVGVAPEDDDGNAASNLGEGKVEPKLLGSNKSTSRSKYGVCSQCNQNFLYLSKKGDKLFCGDFKNTNCGTVRYSGQKPLPPHIESIDGAMQYLAEIQTAKADHGELPF